MIGKMIKLGLFVAAVVVVVQSVPDLKRYMELRNM